MIATWPELKSLALGLNLPEQYGGGGSNDFRFNMILAEELAAAGIGGAGLGLTLHNDITTPYFIEYCNPEQAVRWLPGIGMMKYTLASSKSNSPARPTTNACLRVISSRRRRPA